MALYDIEDKNGVTKVETSIGFVYHFTQVIISTNTESDSMQWTQWGQTTSEYVQFSNIVDKRNSSNIEQYCDNLAITGFYDDKGSTTNVANLTNGEQQILYAINGNNELLKDVVFLLKNIAE